MPYVLGNKEFSLEPKGAGSVQPTVFSSRDFDLRVSRTLEEKMPNASVRLNAYGLATLDARAAAASRGAVPPGPRDLPRAWPVARGLRGGLPGMGADLAGDAERRLSLGLPSRRIPNVEQAENFYFGKRSPMLRVYDKTPQIEDEGQAVVVRGL